MPLNLLITDREKVREQWKNTNLEIEEYIQILKEWLKTQKHLPEIPNNNTIEYVLTMCKYSVEKSKQTLDMVYTMRSIMPEIYCHPLKSPYKEDLARMGYIVMLPNLTETLLRIIILKYHENSGIIFDPDTFIAATMNLYEIKLQEDLAMGDIIIFDLENFEMQHLLKLGPTYFKKMSLILEKVMRNRVKEVHILHYPPIYEKLVPIMKMVLKKKILDRIYLHSDTESLFKSIPKELLPSDYGGSEKSLQELTDLWQLKFKEYEERFDKLEKMKVNEDLREQPLANSEMLGYYGNFKKLDVD